MSAIAIGLVGLAAAVLAYAVSHMLAVAVLVGMLASFASLALLGRTE
jgi:hypothetical protein